MENPHVIVTHNQEPSTSNGHDTLVVLSETPSLKLKHNPGISVDWSSEEQAILDDGLKKFASESILNRYGNISVSLPDKTIRDIALRCKWIEVRSKKREKDVTRKAKEKKERVTKSRVKSSRLTDQPSIPLYSIYDDVISFKGATGKLLEENAQALTRISTNFTDLQTLSKLNSNDSTIQENINLLCQTHENILRITQTMNEFPETPGKMPALPVKMNEALANIICSVCITNEFPETPPLHVKERRVSKSPEKSTRLADQPGTSCEGE